MYGGSPPWGTITPSEQVVLLSATDTGDEFRVALARFTGTDPDDGKAYDEPDIAVVDADGARLRQRSQGPPPTSTPGCGTGAPTGCPRRHRIRARGSWSRATRGVRAAGRRSLASHSTERSR